MTATVGVAAAEPTDVAAVAVKAATAAPFVARPAATLSASSPPLPASPLPKNLPPYPRAKRVCCWWPLEPACPKPSFP